MVVKSSIFFFKVKGLNNGFSCNAGSYFKEMMIDEVVRLNFFSGGKAIENFSLPISVNLNCGRSVGRSVGLTE